MVPATADPAAVERVLAETGVQTTLPAPSWAEYADVIARAVAESLVGFVGPVGAALAAYGWLATAVTILLIGVVGAWLVVMVLRLVEKRRRGGAAAAVTSLSGEPADVPRDARAWRRELDRRLDQGLVGPALEALWWWFACSAAGTSDVERSCTSRELVRRAGRADLAGPAGELDRWLYGPRRPVVSELRGLLRRAEQVVS
jgi:hypothetical protein